MTKKVFISSTAEDLADYREAARDAAIGAGLLPIQMEYFVASGERPPLAACLDKVSEADVLVLIVAHRYGWVPDEQGQHHSITWLECERARADGHEVLAFVMDEKYKWPAELKEDYRIAAAVQGGQATPELLAKVQRNVEKLKEFKAWVDELGIRGTFTTSEDLRGRVSDALREWKQRQTSPGPGPGYSPPRSKQPTFPEAYRRWLLGQCADIDLLGLQAKQGQAIKLNHVYVPLITSVVAAASLGKRQDVSAENEDQQKPQLLLDQLDQHSLYVAGDPGSGKSTFCRWVAWLTASGSLPTSEVAAEEDYVESFPQVLRERLPLLIRLRDVWNYLPQQAGRSTLAAAELAAALGNWVDTTRPGDLDWATVTPHLEHGSALFIFDGVDEVPMRVGEGPEAYYPRAMLIAGLIDAAAAWKQAGNRLLVTSRPYGLDDAQVRQLPLRQAPIRELDDPLQKLLVHRWFCILQEDADEAKDTANAMLQHLQARAELEMLTANPMLLTAMCVIYHEGRRLPQDKHDLYERIVDNVLHNRYGNDMTELEMAREYLSVVAYGMHTGAVRGRENDTSGAASYQEIERMLRTYREESSVTFSGFKGALRTRDELLQRSGLLLSRGDKKAGFYHFTFQDFLAARRMADIERDSLFEIFCERAQTPEWRNTLAFLFSSQLANSREQATRLLNQIILQLTPESVGLAVVAADSMETLLGRDNRLRLDVEEKFKNICLAGIDNEVEVQARQTLGLAVGRLSDPRVVQDLRSPSAYAEIPADEYAYQDGRQTIKAAFLLSKYPVTNSQFQIFIEGGGYSDRSVWSDAGWEWKGQHAVVEPRYLKNSKWNAPNQPVVGVSWYEAEAFCRWAGGFLPTERQWEAAARGPEGLEYPWGPDWEDGICNSHEAGMGVTSPVGLFPRSKSRDFGLEDMAGNVWEWCRDSEADYRVIRGGSRGNVAGYCRAADRHWNLPGYRLDYLGFRVAAVPPGGPS